MSHHQRESRLKLDSEFDRLGNLPSDVAEKILSLLPINEAVRTSILSSKWRYKWAMLPDLVFDDELSFPGKLCNHEKFVKIVDHVVFLHIGTISKFKLSHHHLEGAADIGKWILHQSRNSIKEFTFNFWKRTVFKMPSCLFSCQDLVNLELRYCWLKPPRTFMGFKSLKKLKLTNVTLNQNDFENLIVCCPLLEKLAMVFWRGFTKVKIDAPNLRVLVLAGAFEDVCLQNTLKLESIIVGFQAHGDQRQVPANSSSFLKLLSQCAHVHVAFLLSGFLKYLATGDLTVKIPKPFAYLVRLQINISFNDPEEVLTALCLLRSAPALRRLHVKVHQEGEAVEEVNSWLDDNQNFELRELQNVEIYGITGTKAELDFLKFLLLNSPMLEKLFVKPASQYSSSELLKSMIQFRRSSALAEIIYLDP